MAKQAVVPDRANRTNRPDHGDETGSDA